MTTTVILRWIARVWSIASLTLLALFATSGGGVPTRTEVVALAFFPVGIAAGMVMGWWREGIGGAITAASLVCFYLWMFAVGGRLPGGPYFILFAAPGLLFLVNHLIEKSRQSEAPGNAA